MKRSLFSLVVLAGATIVLSGCYTILRAPSAASPEYASETYFEEEDRYERERDAFGPRIGQFDDDRYGVYGRDPYGNGAGIPIFGYDSANGLYGFGSPFSYGYGSPYGGYGPAAGPYGYGYDPYYSGTNGTYIPPGYELVTTQELVELRADSRMLSTIGGSAGPSVGETQENLRVRDNQARQAWIQRTYREVPRRSTSAVRTTRSSSAGSSTAVEQSSSSGSRKASSSNAKSGSSAAKRRKTKR